MPLPLDPRRIGGTLLATFEARGRQQGRAAAPEEEVMHRTKLAIAGAVMGVIAAVALGQNADKNTAAPTANDYKLGVIEPAEGATITGSTVRVVVNTQVRESLGDPNDRRDVNSMPRPDVDVYLDGALKGTLHAQDNVIQVDDLVPGTHKLTFVAKNRSNEIIDRREIHFSSINSEGVAATSGPADTTSSSPAAASSTMASAEPAKSQSGPTSGTGSSSSTYSSSSSYSPPPAANSSSSSYPPPRSLPATASNDAELAIAGAALLVTALGLRRFSRSA
jgi:hypothetical protein